MAGEYCVAGVYSFGSASLLGAGHGGSSGSEPFSGNDEIIFNEVVENWAVVH